MDDEAEWRLLAAVREHPDDDETRSVYADWLTERGDTRGEYLRQEIETYRNGPPMGSNMLRWHVRTIDPEWIAAIARRFDLILVGVADTAEANPALEDAFAQFGFDVRRFLLGDPQRLLTGVDRKLCDSVVAHYAPHLQFEVRPRHPFE